MKLFLCFLVTLSVILCEKATVYYENGKYKFVSGVIDKENGVCFGEYKIEMFKKGWDWLTLESNTNLSKFTDEQKAYACGFLEGKLTYEQISLFIKNANAYSFENGTMPEKMIKFFSEQKEYADVLAEKKKDDPFYRHIGLMNKQVEGVIAGHNENAETIVSWETFQVIQSMGDLSDLKKAVLKSGKRIDEMNGEEIAAHFIETTHCSAIWKVLPDMSDVFFAHNTWTTYGSQYRIYKEYNFHYQTKGNEPLANYISFPGYPGITFSNDDIYISSNDLAIIETTNGILNDDLYEKITPHSFLYWQRVMVATRLSNDALTWMKYFGIENSGTYNNQWQVLDLKKFTPGFGFEKGAFFVGEQMPGMFYYEEQTQKLAAGYWPSYNVPFYLQINEAMGYPKALKEHPELNCKINYQSCSRANIFRRDQTKVVDSESMKDLILFNDFKNDKLSFNDAALSLASRYEYSDKYGPRCHGVTDSKFSSFRMWKDSKKFWIIGRPTKTDDLPFFSWDDPKVIQSCPRDKFLHLGMPTVYDFDWLEFYPRDI